MTNTPKVINLSNEIKWTVYLRYVMEGKAEKRPDHDQIVKLMNEYQNREEMRGLHKEWGG